MHHNFSRPLLALILSLTILLSGNTYVRAEESLPGEDVSVSETSSEDTNSEEGSSASAEDSLTSDDSSVETLAEEEISSEESSAEESSVEDPVLLPEAPVFGSVTNKKAGIYLTWSKTANALSYQVLRKDAAGALATFSEALAEGKEPLQFTRDWVEHFRDLMMIRYAKDPQDILNLSLENIARLKGQAESAGMDAIFSCIRKLSQALADARWAAKPRILIELAIIEMCR